MRRGVARRVKNVAALTVAMRLGINTVDAGIEYLIGSDVTMHRGKVEAKRIALAPRAASKRFSRKLP